MGGSYSVEIPGGGTEGYHVLRVRKSDQFYMNLYFVYFYINDTCVCILIIGARWLARTEGWIGSFF